VQLFMQIIAPPRVTGAHSASLQFWSEEVVPAVNAVRMLVSLFLHLIVR
jgi:hypothetical protein